MSADDVHDARVAGLEQLPRLRPDAEYVERTRLRLRAELSRRRGRPDRTVGFAWRRPRPVAVSFCVFCILYVCALVTTTLRLQGMIR